MATTNELYSVWWSQTIPCPCHDLVKMAQWWYLYRVSFFGTCDRNGKIENSCTSKAIISMRFANESKLQQNTCDWASLAMTISLTTIKPTNFTTSPYFTPALLFYDNKKTTLWLLWEYYVVFMDLESMEMFVIFPD